MKSLVVESGLGRNDKGRKEQEEEKSENIGEKPMSRTTKDGKLLSRVVDLMGVTWESKYAKKGLA
jgi:hypothetical protein